jgi:hypothetical protein
MKQPGWKGQITLLVLKHQRFWQEPQDSIRAVLQLRRLVSGFQPRRPGFDPRSDHVGFVVDKVAQGQVVSEYFGFPCQFSFHQMLHTHHHTSSGAGTIGQTVVDVQSGVSLRKKKKKLDQRNSEPHRALICNGTTPILALIRASLGRDCVVRAKSIPPFTALITASLVLKTPRLDPLYSREILLLAPNATVRMGA